MQLKQESVVWVKAGVLVLIAGYFIWNAVSLSWFFLLDNVNLLIHEAGHWIFWFFGEFISFAGGTILQILVPLCFVLYFFFKGKRFSAGLIMFWLGQNFINISIYAGDAVVMKLPLLGGGIHDWNYMLGRLGLLSSTDVIAKLFWLIGFIIIVFGLVVSLTSLFKKQEKVKNLTRRTF